MARLNIVLTLVLLALAAVYFLPRDQVRERLYLSRTSLAPLKCETGITDYYAVQLRRGYTFEKHKYSLRRVVNLETAAYSRYQAEMGLVYGAALNSTATAAVRADHGVLYVECVEPPASVSGKST